MEETINSPVKAEQEKEVKAANYYAYCRIPGGMQFEVSTGDGTRTIVLKSGTAMAAAPDGTVSFSVNPDVYGVTKLSRADKAQIEEQIKATRFFKKGFVFFAANKEAGDKKAAELLAQNPKIGMEPLDSTALTGGASVYKPD